MKPLWRAIEALAWSAFFVFATLLLALRFWLLPDIERYRGDVVAAIERSVGLPIKIAGIEAGWLGLRPQISLSDVHLYDHQGREVLALPSIRNVVSWRSLLYAQVRLHSLAVDGPRLEVRRDADGALYVAGMKLAADGERHFADWLLGQEEIVISNAEIEWRDEKRAAPPLALSALNLRLRNSGDQHSIGLTARPPEELGSSVELRAQLEGGSATDPAAWNGRLYAQLGYTDLAAWRAWIDYPLDVRAGQGAIRVWTTLENGRVKEGTAGPAARYESRVGRRSRRAEAHRGARPLCRSRHARARRGAGVLGTVGKHRGERGEGQRVPGVAQGRARFSAHFSRAAHLARNPERAHRLGAPGRAPGRSALLVAQLLQRSPQRQRLRCLYLHGQRPRHDRPLGAAEPRRRRASRPLPAAAGDHGQGDARLARGRDRLRAGKRRTVAPAGRAARFSLRRPCQGPIPGFSARREGRAELRQRLAAPLRHRRRAAVRARQDGDRRPPRHAAGRATRERARRYSEPGRARAAGRHQRPGGRKYRRLSQIHRRDAGKAHDRRLYRVDERRRQRQAPPEAGAADRQPRRHEAGGRVPVRQQQPHPASAAAAVRARQRQGRLHRVHAHGERRAGAPVRRPARRQRRFAPWRGRYRGGGEGRGDARRAAAGLRLSVAPLPERCGGLQRNAAGARRAHADQCRVAPARHLERAARAAREKRARCVAAAHRGGC